MIAQVALHKHELPLFGSFSSAGPFVFGPLFYYQNMLSYKILPSIAEAPWVLMVVMGTLTVIVMIYTGFVVGGKRLAIIFGFLVAFSPQFVSRSTSLSQHSVVGITTALLLLFFILFYKRKKMVYIFWAGLSLGSAISMHYQALNLFIFFPAVFFIPKISFKKKVFSVLIMFTGFLIPSFPLLYWDSQQNFANIRNILDYVLIGQYRIYVPNSWTIYTTRFLPDYWANVAGGNIPIAIILIFLTALTFLYTTYKRKIQGEIFVLGIIFAILLFIIRYYRGERFDGYMIYTAPFIFLLSGWAIFTFYELLKTSKLVRKGSALKRNIITSICISLFTILLVSDYDNAKQFIFHYNEVEKMGNIVIESMVKKYPNSKFSIYDYASKTNDTAYALVFLLNKKDLIKSSGIPIGVDRFGKKGSYGYKNFGSFAGLAVVDLSSNKKKKISKNYVRVNPEDIYDDLITRWTKKEKLKSPFSLVKYIQERLGFRD